MSWTATMHAFARHAIKRAGDETIVPSEITATEHHVLLALAFHADRHKQEAFPSAQTIADETRLSRRSVISALAALQRNGHVEAVRSAGQHRPTTYRLPASSANPAPLEDASSATAAPLTGSEVQTAHASSANGASRGGAAAPKPLLTKKNQRARAHARPLEQWQIDKDEERRQRLAQQRPASRTPPTPWTCPHELCDGTGMILDLEANRARDCDCRAAMIEHQQAGAGITR